MQSNATQRNAKQKQSKAKQNKTKTPTTHKTHKNKYKTKTKTITNNKKYILEVYIMPEHTRKTVLLYFTPHLPKAGDERLHPLLQIPGTPVVGLHQEPRVVHIPAVHAQARPHKVPTSCHHKEGHEFMPQG